MVSRGVYSESWLVADAVLVRQCGVPSRMADEIVAMACRETHRIAVARLVSRSAIHGEYLSRLNSGDEASETALAILRGLDRADVRRGGTAVVNWMVTVAANGIRNRIRNGNAKKRKAVTVSFEGLDYNIGDAYGGQPERTGIGNEVGDRRGLAAIVAATATSHAAAADTGTRRDGGEGCGVPLAANPFGGRGRTDWARARWVQTELELGF